LPARNARFLKKYAEIEPKTRSKPQAYSLLKENLTAFTRNTAIRQHQPNQRKFMKTLTDLFLEGLRDMYYAEQQLVKALPKLAKATTNDELRDGIEKHLVETEGHVQKIEAVFEAFDQPPKTKKCAAILGIIKEAEEIVSENKKSPTINAAIIFAAQKAEHYEIASYGTLREWAQILGNNRAVDLVEEILDEEKAADKALTDLAVSVVNISAEEAIETA